MLLYNHCSNYIVYSLANRQQRWRQRGWGGGRGGGDTAPSGGAIAPVPTTILSKDIYFFVQVAMIIPKLRTVPRLLNRCVVPDDGSNNMQFKYVSSSSHQQSVPTCMNKPACQQPCSGWLAQPSNQSLVSYSLSVHIKPPPYLPRVPQSKIFRVLKIMEFSLTGYYTGKVLKERYQGKVLKYFLRK